MQKTSLFSKKLSEISENVSFNSEFGLGLDIQPFKVIIFFFNVNFSKYACSEWVK